MLRLQAEWTKKEIELCKCCGIKTLDFYFGISEFNLFEVTTIGEG